MDKFLIYNFGRIEPLPLKIKNNNVDSHNNIYKTEISNFDRFFHPNLIKCSKWKRLVKENRKAFINTQENKQNIIIYLFPTSFMGRIINNEGNLLFIDHIITVPS